ncbi:MAG: DUF433 domain-containing protein [Bacteroidota bacterium]
MLGDWRDHIVSTPDVLRGKPRLVNTRIPARLVLGCLAAGHSATSILDEFPDCSEAHVAACLSYARDLADCEDAA